uniref:Uncharacterized protein n=1 Tax=Glossina pallidipes TaxID=7398 RepID=A0A1A9ZJP3_GLOPL
MHIYANHVVQLCLFPKTIHLVAVKSCFPYSLTNTVSINEIQLSLFLSGERDILLIYVQIHLTAQVAENNVYKHGATVQIDFDPNIADNAKQWNRKRGESFPEEFRYTFYQFPPSTDRLLSIVSDIIHR